MATIQDYYKYAALATASSVRMGGIGADRLDVIVRPMSQDVASIACSAVALASKRAPAFSSAARTESDIPINITHGVLITFTHGVLITFRNRTALREGTSMTSSYSSRNSDRGATL